jgi:hypothetical protein
MILLIALDVQAVDAPVRLSITNDGTQPFRCLIVFGHWVTMDVGLMKAGEMQTIPMMRGSPKGALYIPRFDGRQMMIENVICGTEAAWSDSLEQVLLMPIRDGTGSAYRTKCQTGRRITCSAPDVDE